MELSTPVAVTRQELEYLAAATSKNGACRILGFARLEAVDGRTYLVATDSHRMHAVKVSDKTLPSALVDIKRIIHELKFVRAAKSVGFVFSESGEVSVELTTEKGDSLDTITRTVVFLDSEGKNEHGTYPKWVRVVPSAEEVNGKYEGASFNFHYIAEASILSRNTANRVFLSGVNSSRPHVIAPQSGNQWLCRWFSVIMPMAGESVENRPKAEAEHQAKIEAHNRKAEKEALKRAA